MTEIKLGKISGVALHVAPSAVIGSLFLWLGLGWIAVGVLDLPIVGATIGSFVSMLLHWISEILHQLGHAWVARRVGHPMIGIRLWGLLSTSLYPDDEGALPAAIHIRRALGGPALSFIVTLLSIPIAYFLAAVNPVARWVGLFLVFENFVIFTLGAFLPLGFNDGSTLLYWWGRQ